eukprot:scaffold44250_cov234-Skeletonema_marinoi.AAC.3
MCLGAAALALAEGRSRQRSCMHFGGAASIIACGICYLVSVPVDSYTYSGGCLKKPTTSNLRLVLDVADSCFDAVPYKKTSKAVAVACLVLGNTSPMKHPLKLTAVAVEVVLVNMRPISDLIGLVLTETKAYKDLHHMFRSSQPRIISSLILTEHEIS